MSISSLRMREKAIIVLAVAGVSIIIGLVLYPYLLNEYGKEWAQLGMVSTQCLIAVYGIYLILSLD